MLLSNGRFVVCGTCPRTSYLVQVPLQEARTTAVRAQEPSSDGMGLNERAHAEPDTFNRLSPMRRDGVLVHVTRAVIADWTKGVV